MKIVVRYIDSDELWVINSLDWEEETTHDDSDNFTSFIGDEYGDLE